MTYSTTCHRDEVSSTPRRMPEGCEGFQCPEPNRAFRHLTRMTTPDLREWLETDGLGGFASGTASGIRTRRYHGLLTVAATPPTGRMMLVNGLDASLQTPGGVIPLTSQRYLPDVVVPHGPGAVTFEHQPWPTWRYTISDTASVVLEMFLVHGSPRAVLRWRLDGVLPSAVLRVRPFLSGRDYHALHHENPGFDFTPHHVGDDVLEWTPYSGVPGVRSHFNGRYLHEPVWYRQFLYSEERGRGLDDVEDLASPGIFEFDLTDGDAVWVVETAGGSAPSEPVEVVATRDRRNERKRRAAFPTMFHRAADQYLVRRGEGSTIVAGYPWFTDWGRDTFIALRGLCIATGRIPEAKSILLAWAEAVSEGMLPNRFPDAGEMPEFNSVDASLWFIVAVRELLESSRPKAVTSEERRRLLAAVQAILHGYSRGTRFGIRADDDGLLAAGVDGVQLTWMDAKIGDEVVTPRIGKPVEVQALWLNALAFGSMISDKWRSIFERGHASFEATFWNDERQCLFDVVDMDHVKGRNDGALRPNQILAVGGLPVPLLTGERARRVVEIVEATLLTPVGLRSLAPGEAGYTGRYAGGVSARDHAYHQGTVWPWLIGAFVEAWARVRGNTPEAVHDAHQRFVAPLVDRIERTGSGHLAEIADADEPFDSKGCPFQAWSLGEVLRVGTRNASRTAESKSIRGDMVRRVVAHSSAPLS